MYPWLWLWTPQIHFPWSGSVAQHIEPDTDWFFVAIRPAAGNGEIERKAFEVASYGRQLGLITEVLLAQNEQGAVTPEQGALALERLKEIHEQIEAVKAEEARAIVKSVAEQLELLRLRHPQELAKLFT